MEKYAGKALELGGEDAKIISTEDIVFDPRTIFKCMYGCDDWGKNGPVLLPQKH